MSTREFVHRRSTVPGVLALYGYAAGGLTEGLHRGLPSRGLTFILSMDDPVGGAGTPGDWRAGRLDAFDTLLAGLHLSPTYIRQPIRQRGVQISVHPLAAGAPAGVPAGDPVRSSLPAQNVLGAGAARLRDTLHGMPTWPGRLEAAAADV